MPLRVLKAFPTGIDRDKHPEVESADPALAGMDL